MVHQLVHIMSGADWDSYHTIRRDVLWTARGPDLAAVQPNVGRLFRSFKDINQPTGATSAIGDTPAYNLMSDLTHRYSLFGLGLTSSAGVFYNTERLSNFTYNVAPEGNATLPTPSSIGASRCPVIPKSEMLSENSRNDLRAWVI
jgi:hypothetical protein